MSADGRRALFEALDQAEPLLLDALAPEGVTRIEYVVGFVPPYDVWVWLGTASDAQRDALPIEMPARDKVLTAFRTVKLPETEVGEVGTVAQSQETVDRDYEGSWFNALR